jgi:hypothetical protein
MGSLKNGNRGLARCLFFWAVLVFGLVQWSFLPVLIQTDFLQGNPSVEAQDLHTAKFAAPFKSIFADNAQSFLNITRVDVPPPPQVTIHFQQSALAIEQNQFSTQRQLRSPPSS